MGAEELCGDTACLFDAMSIKRQSGHFIFMLILDTCSLYLDISGTPFARSPYKKKKKKTCS